MDSISISGSFDNMTIENGNFWFVNLKVALSILSMLGHTSIYLQTGWIHVPIYQIETRLQLFPVRNWQSVSVSEPNHAKIASLQRTAVSRKELWQKGKQREFYTQKVIFLMKWWYTVMHRFVRLKIAWSRPSKAISLYHAYTQIICRVEVTPEVELFQYI